MRDETAPRLRRNDDPELLLHDRKSTFILARRQWTRAWWSIALERFELLTGAPVLQELLDGPASRHANWLTLIGPVPVLETNKLVVSAAETYVRRMLMPASGADALHLAIASVHRCDYLVTWDTRHLANGLKFHHIRKVNDSLGLHVPIVLTPLELLGRVL